MANWLVLAEQVLGGHELTDEEALAILDCPDEELLLLLQGAYRIRSAYYGNKVKLNMIINAKSGLCPENCGYCSQSAVSTAPVKTYKMVDKETLLRGAEEAHRLRIGTYCIVASGRGPSDKEIDTVVSAVKEIKERFGLKVCACLGILKPEQAARLKEAGVDRYNHNINTSKQHHPNITTSHTYDDRVRTVETVKEAGLSPCSGVIIGMKETKQDVVDMARSLRALDADSIPVNVFACDRRHAAGWHERIKPALLFEGAGPFSLYESNQRNPHRRRARSEFALTSAAWPVCRQLDFCRRLFDDRRARKVSRLSNA